MLHWHEFTLLDAEHFTFWVLRFCVLMDGLGFMYLGLGILGLDCRLVVVVECYGFFELALRKSMGHMIGWILN